MTKTVLCGKPSGCCPTVEIEECDCSCKLCKANRMVTIVDDCKRHITMTYAQYLVLKETEL